MATAPHFHVPIDGTASSGPTGVSRTLAVLEGTLSELASRTAVAAESLRDDRSGPAPVSDHELATWWLDRLVRAALATRETCRAARAAIDDRAPAHAKDRSSGSARAACPEASSHAIRPQRRYAGRWIVVGYDGSQAAGRALLRAADAAGDRDAVVIVITAAPIDSAGAAAEALPADPSRLLTVAKTTVTTRASLADVVLVAREGDPAEELLEVARAARADLVVVGRRGADSAARTPLGSVATHVVEQAPCDVLIVA